jgi:hypothetical protein
MAGRRLPFAEKFPHTAIIIAGLQGCQPLFIGVDKYGMKIRFSCSTK